MRQMNGHRHHGDSGGDDGGQGVVGRRGEVRVHNLGRVLLAAACWLTGW